MQAQPFMTAKGASWTRLKSIFIFYNMYILNTKTITTTQNSIGIMSFVNILKYKCYVTGSGAKYIINPW